MKRLLLSILFITILTVSFVADNLSLACNMTMIEEVEEKPEKKVFSYDCQHLFEIQTSQGHILVSSPFAFYSFSVNENLHVNLLSPPPEQA